MMPVAMDDIREGYLILNIDVKYLSSRLNYSPVRDFNIELITNRVIMQQALTATSCTAILSQIVLDLTLVCSILISGKTSAHRRWAISMMVNT